MPESQSQTETPRTYNRAGAAAGTPTDALDGLEAGDRILFEDRTQPLTVARVVSPDDPVGQALTASVVKMSQQEQEAREANPTIDSSLENGDVFLTTNKWGLTGKQFALVHGPQGGFYALARSPRSDTGLALHRAVRSYHKTKMGMPGQGAFDYETTIDSLTVTGHGEPPETLDEAGDLPAFEEIAENPVVTYDSDDETHYEIGTVADVIDEGIEQAHARAARERESETPDETVETVDLPPREHVATTSQAVNAECHSTVTVTGVEDSENGPQAVLDAPAPWDAPEDATPFNEAIKQIFPYSENHRSFDPDRTVWTLDVDSLRAVAGILSEEFGYAFMVEEGVLPSEND